MSAAALRYPTVSFAGAAAEFFGQVPASPIARRGISDRAKVVLAGLCIIARGSKTWVQATIEEIALATGHSARKARQGLAELTSAGLVEWESIGAKFRVLFRLRGRDEIGPSASAPRIAMAPSPAPVCAPDPVPVCVPKRVTNEHPPLEPPYKEKRERDRQTDTHMHAREGPPEIRSDCLTDPPPERTGSTEKARPWKPPSQEIPMRQQSLPIEPAVDAPPDPFATLVDRVASVLGEATPARLRAVLDIHGAAKIEMALRKIEAAEERPRSPWGLMLSILNDWLETGAVVKVPAEKPKIDPSTLEPRDYMLNYNPVGPIRELTAEDVPSGDRLRETIEQARAEDAIGRLARGCLKGWIKQGLVDAAAVPRELLADSPPAAPRKPDPRPEPTVRVDPPALAGRPVANRFPAPSPEVIASDSILRAAFEGQPPTPTASKSQPAVGASPGKRPHGRLSGCRIMPRKRLGSKRKRPAAGPSPGKI